MNSRPSPRGRRGSLRVLAMVVVSAALAGCSQSSEPGPNGADRALKDPMGYGPRLTPADNKLTQPAGPAGRDDSLQRDLKNVFDP
jgi:hypothetical protein